MNCAELHFKKPIEEIFNFHSLGEGLTPEERIQTILDAPPLELTWTVASPGIQVRGEICTPDGKISVRDIPDGCSGYHPRIAQLLNNNDLSHKLWRISIYRRCVRLHYYLVVPAPDLAHTLEPPISRGTRSTQRDTQRGACLHSSIITIDTSKACHFLMFVKVKSFNNYPERHRLCEYTYDLNHSRMRCILADIDFRRGSTKERDVFIC